MTERIDVSRADDPRDVVHRAVACLAQGGTVGLPTESTYGVVGGALHPGAIARLGSISGEGAATLLLKGPGEVDDWADVSTEVGRRLARRAWPGAVTLVFPVAHRGLSAGSRPRSGGSWSLTASSRFEPLRTGWPARSSGSCLAP